MNKPFRSRTGKPFRRHVGDQKHGRSSHAKQGGVLFTYSSIFWRFL